MHAIRKCNKHVLEILGYYDDNPELLIWYCRNCNFIQKGKEVINEKDNKKRSREASE